MANVSSIAVPKSGHIARMSSLPSIEEDDNSKPVQNSSSSSNMYPQSHRRGPSASALSKPRFSLKSIGSISTNSSETSVSLTSKDLLSNMMTSYKDRDPYEHYTVLTSLGQGSIGSVEKVVRRRHHHVVKRDENHSGADSKHNGFFGGIFHDCCVVSPDDNDKLTNGHGHHERRPSLLQSLLSKVTNSHRSTDAFQSVKPSPSIKTDSNRSNVSENSAFSAPNFDTQQYSLANSSHPWNSIRSDKQSTRKHGPSQHAMRKYALKSIRLDRTEHNNSVSKADEAELRNEISILRSLDHPHIVHILEVYFYQRSIYLLIDLCEGGDLYVLDPYTEMEAKCIMKQLCNAVSYMHRRGVVHRDLKYENVMFVERMDRARLSIKLIDFGLSMKYGGGNKNNMTDFVGTIYTMAPEVIRGNYNYKCDIWSLGVMTYMLLSSQIPFVGRDMSEIAKEIMRGRYSFSGKKWRNISKEGKNFIEGLLLKDPSKRPNTDQALKHPWLKRATTTKMAPHLSLDIQICKSIEMFSTYSWLHRLALMVIGYKYTGKETTLLREVFTSFDYKNTGTVEVDELQHAFALYDKYSREEIDEIFAAVDMNGAGKISWTEFLAATIEAVGKVGEEEFAECFDRLDCDSSGFISTEVSQSRYVLLWSFQPLKDVPLVHILTEPERDPWRLAR
ncbi:hypothetical protein ACHAXN_005100 [Cyclotella atomus]